MRNLSNLFNVGAATAWRLSAVAAVGALLFTVACREDRDPILPPGAELDGREYYPVGVGQFREYDVVDHYWQYNADSVVNYQMREEIDTVFTGAGGELTYRIKRSQRLDSTANWRPDSAMMVVADKQFIRHTSSNVPMLEMIFPIREGKAWNPSQLNEREPVATARHYEGVGQAFTTNGQQFAKTVRVVDEPLESILGLRKQQAVYAWNIGRVYRKRQVLDYCNQSDVDQGRCQLGTGYIVRGFEREEQLRNWGPR